MTNKLTINFDFEPISMNKLYCNIPGQSRRFISTDGKRFKAQVKDAVLEQLTKPNLTILSNLVDKPLEVCITVRSPTWLLKDKKSVRKKDIENQGKALIDSVFTEFKEKFPDLDDCYIWKLSFIKEFGEPVLVTVDISEHTVQ
jgi:Holliday junction resolvase RusA-like endonuclease